MISVLCPTRERPALLRESHESLFKTAARPQDIEFLAAVDPDDFEANASSVSWLPDGSVRVMPERYGYDGLHVYYQLLAKAARGEWLLVWNDDTVMLTPGWDGVLTALSPGVLVADLQSHHSPMCCFPAVRRGAVEALGRFCSDNPHVDTFWQDMGHATGTIEAVPVHVQHNQVEGRPGWGNQHRYYEPPHQAELARCAQRLREWLA